MKIQLSELRRVAAPLSIALVVAAAFATTAAAAGRSPVQVTQATDVAGSSPYTGRHCNIPTPDWVAPGGVEAEPTVAVNPRDAENKIAAWMDPTRSSIDTSYTRNGGKTWIKSVPKGVDACGGNHQQAWEASGDVWLSFGPDGTAYLTTLAWAHFVTAPTSDYVSVVYVLVSRDGGKSWSKPVLVSRPRGVSDKDMIVADPHHSGTVYDAFDNAGFGLVGPPRGSNYLVVAKSTDWGHSWRRTVVARFPPDRPVSDSQLSILPDGNLVETAVGTNAAGVGTIWAWRSTDRGRTWSKPSHVAALTPGSAPAICGATYRGGSTFDADAVAGPHSVVLVINDGAAAAQGHGKLILARTDDSGRSWHTHPLLRSSNPVLLASIAANERGQLGLIYDEVDTSRIGCTPSAVIPTTTRVSISRDGGTSWSRPTTVGPTWFNQADALVAPQYFLGDYQNIVGAPDGFTSVSVQGHAVTASTAGPELTGKTGVIVANEELRH